MGAKLASRVEPQEDEDAENAGKNPNKVTRKCRDVLCIGLFAVFWFGMLIVALVAVNSGDPYRLLYGTDYNGDPCGGALHPDDQLTYYPRMNSDLLAAMQSGETNPMNIELYGICVKECPVPGTFVCNYDIEESKNNIVGEEEQLKFVESNVDSWFDNGPCWYVPLPSDPVLFRCFPDTNVEKNETLRCIRPDSEGGGYYAYDAAGNIQLDSPQLKVYYEEDKNFINGWVPNEKCKTTEVQTESKQNKPTQPNPMLEQLNGAAAEVGRMFGDIQKTFSLIAINGGVLAVVFGFVFLLLLKYCAGVMVWLTVLSVVVISVALTVFCADKAGLIGDYVDTSALVAAGGLEVTDKMKAEADAEAANVQNYTYATYAMATITIILLVIVIFFRKKIKISIGIIREASACVRKIPLLIIFPMVPFAMLFILVAYWVAVAALIQSGAGITMEDLTAAADEATAAASAAASAAADAAAAAAAAALPNVTLPNITVPAAPASAGLLSAVNATNTGLDMKSLSPDETKKLVMAYHFFGFLWTMNLINAIQMCTIAGAVCSYYWAPGANTGTARTGSNIGHFPIANAFFRCFRYHFGSLLFGALIIAIVQFIRACLEYIDQKTKKLQDSNKFLKILMKVVKCLMWCLEKVVKFVSKNAYIIIAMKGKSFCGATIDAFKLIFANIAQIGIISAIATLLLTLARISITASCAFITFNTITSDPRFTKGGELEVSTPMIPVLVTTIVAFCISTVFMGVYGLAIDTILVCFCEDRKVNSDGTYYMSTELQKLIGAKVSKKGKGGAKADKGGGDEKGGGDDGGGSAEADT